MALSKFQLRYRADSEFREGYIQRNRAKPRKTALLVGTVLRCKCCGTSFVYELPGKRGNSRTSFCSEACSRRLQRRLYHRRAHHHSHWKKGRVLRIAQRDSWICGICGEDVLRGLLYPHPRSPSIDHIVPLSIGGSNRRDNVRLSHLLCNVMRGNGTGSQSA